MVSRSSIGTLSSRSTTFAQQRRRWNDEARILHVMRVSRIVAAQPTQERKHVLADDAVHLARRKVLEPGPAEVVVQTSAVFADAVAALGKYPSRQRLLQPRGFVLLERMQIVQPTGTVDM